MVFLKVLDSQVNDYPSAYIDMSIACCHCGDILWYGVYERGIIGRLKKKIRKNGWIYREGEGTVCRDCSSKPFHAPHIETSVSGDDAKRFLNNMGIVAVEAANVGSFIPSPTEPQIFLNIACMHCGCVLWHGFYEKGIIGKLKKLIKKNRWIHHPTEGTLCCDCAHEFCG